MTAAVASLPTKTGPEVTLRRAMIRQLQDTIDCVKSPVPVFPTLECVVLQEAPAFQVADSSHFIECELAPAAKVSAKDVKGKRIRIQRYVFQQKARYQYTMLIEAFSVLPDQPVPQPSAPLPCQDDRAVREHMQIHQQFLEKASLSGWLDALPSFDAVAIGSTSKQPVVLVSGTPPPPERLFVKGSERAGMMLDVSADDLSLLLGMSAKVQQAASGQSSAAKTKGSLAPEQHFEVDTKEVLNEPPKPEKKEESPRVVPSMGTMDPDVSRSLAYLVSDFNTRPRHIPTTQTEYMGETTQQQVPATGDISSQRQIQNSQQEKEDRPQTQQRSTDINIGMGVNTEKRIERLIQTREVEKKELSTQEQKTDLLDLLKEKDMKNLLNDIEREQENEKGLSPEKASRPVAEQRITAAEFDKYLAWRNFHKQARAINRKLELELFDVGSSEMVEFTVDARTGTETPFRESPAKRKKYSTY